MGRTLVATLLLVVLGFFFFQAWQCSANRQMLVTDNAEIKNIKHGLLSVHNWKRQIAEILTVKVREFDLSPENRRELGGQIQNALNKLMDELEKVLEERRSGETFFQRMAREVVESILSLDMETIRKRIPEFTEIILDALEDEETRDKLRAFLEEKVDQFLYETVGEEDFTTIEVIVEKYNCQDQDQCGDLLQSRIELEDQCLFRHGLFILGLTTLIFLVILLKNPSIKKVEYITLIVLSGALLIGGVTMPMIDIDARIENFNFLLMGEMITFKDQVLFFQSKSIFDVVKILMSTGEYQSILVGGLIFLFSIVFPVSKLLSSLGLVFKPQLIANKVIEFLALKSGKWSMADVMVVAIFMAFIGFRGVIQNQLSQLEQIGEKIEVITTDNSNFGIGFIFFLAFCLGGLVLATVLESKIKYLKSTKI